MDLVESEFFSMTLGSNVRLINNAFSGLHGVANVIPRDILIKKLFDFVQQKVKFIIVSSPAGTGKTSAVSLLKDQLKSDTSFLIHSISFAGTSRLPYELLADSNLVFQNNEWKNPKFWHDKRIIYFLDDAHCRYNDEGFWATLMKGTSGLPGNVQFIIAATYLLEGVGSPVEFGSIQSRIGIADMTLSDEEAMLVLIANLPESQHSFSSLLTLIREECEGNIAALSKAAEFLTERSKLSSTGELDESAAIQSYLSRSLLNRMDRCFGTEANLIALGDSSKDALIELLRNGSIAKVQHNDPMISHLVKCGVLVIHDFLQILFASKLARRYFMNLFYGFRGRSNPNSLIDLVKLAIKSMSASVLNQSVVVSTGDFPKEATFQHLFIAALAAHTTATTSICPELSRLFPSTVACEATEENGIISGEIDFYLNGDLRWGIELLIRGRNIGEHVERFGDFGKYKALQMRDHIIVDFRKGPATNIHLHQKRLTVFFDDKFETCSCVYGAENEKFELALSA